MHAAILSECMVHWVAPLTLRQSTVCIPLSLGASLMAPAASASAWNCTRRWLKLTWLQQHGVPGGVQYASCNSAAAVTCDVCW